MKQTVTSKSYRLTLNIIYLAQALVIVFFSLVVLFLNASGELPPANDLSETFQILIPLVTIVFLSSAYFVFRTLLSKIDQSWELRKKLPKYQVAVMVRSALLELPGLLGAVAAMITGTMYFLSASLLVVIVFIMLRPTLYNIVEDLRLSAAEKALLEDPNSVVSEVDLNER